MARWTDPGVHVRHGSPVNAGDVLRALEGLGIAAAALDNVSGAAGPTSRLTVLTLRGDVLHVISKLRAVAAIEGIPLRGAT